MATKISRLSTSEKEKLFLNKFYSLCKDRSNWSVWSDLITVMACSLGNAAGFAVQKDMETYEEREKEFSNAIKRLGGIEVPAEILGIIVMALEENPEQDFLGSVFMKLELGNHWKGQFFTPYSVCKMMSEINVPDLEAQIAEKGWASVNDPACGAGATLIAMANTMKNHGVNYQEHTLFVAQDIDRVVGMMCYIQLSLLGCAGYVVIADTLSNPLVGSILQPTPNKNQEIWYTPMFASDVWHYRRVFNMMDSIFKI